MTSRLIASPIGLRLTLVSFLLLFIELALIRFLPSQVRMLSYFTNLVLLASFLGLGVGLLLARVRWRLLPLCPLLLAGALYLGKLFSTVLVIQRGEVHHHLWTIYVDLGRAATSVGVTETLVLFFVAVALVFVPLGSELGRLFRLLAPLKGYSLDILGSMIGSLALTLLAAASRPPMVWFAIAGVGLLVAVLAGGRRPLPLIITVIGVALSLFMVRPASDDITWTPYYRVHTQPFPGGFDVTVNASLHQTALDLSPERCAESEAAALIRDEYAAPYRLYRQTHGGPPRTVLILGAGSGNDVTVALQEGAQRVVAVEIDPVIARMGEELHPNRPYLDPRVSLHVTDARSFLRRSTERFDLVIFGTLDSQTLLAGMSTIRLDNYVYTEESIQAALDRVKDDGILALFFMVAQDWISLRLYRMVEAADGRAPLVYRPRESGQIHVTPIFNYVLFTGPGLRETALDQRAAASAAQPTTRLATDDWPYLYLRAPGIPPPYRNTLPLLLGLSVIVVGPFLRRRGSGGRRRAAEMAYYFCMGAGFMLVETKGITELSLLFGSTWKVSGVVITSVLLTILLANLVSLRVDLSRHRWVFPLLGLFLLANWIVPPSAFLALPRFWVAPLAGLYFALPIFAAGLLFARRFRTEPDPDRALGWNLIGAMTGGLAEYLSMAYGIRFLYLVAIAFYGGAFVFDRRGSWRAERGDDVSRSTSVPRSPSAG